MMVTTCSINGKHTLYNTYKFKEGIHKLLEITFEISCNISVTYLQWTPLDT